MAEDRVGNLERTLLELLRYRFQGLVVRLEDDDLIVSAPNVDPLVLANRIDDKLRDLLR